MRIVRSAGVKFMLGGGFAQASYVGRWRSTKDVDLYILPGQRDAAVRALSRAGFHDFYSRASYDRKWIYRSIRNDWIVDLIWAMANQRAQVDESWFDHALPMDIRGIPVLVLPMEELMWCKLYILQRDRCDWVDLFNLLYASGPRIDWDRLLLRLEGDWPLLQGLLAVYGWLHPESALRLPASLRERLGLPDPDPAAGRLWKERVRLLDSRVWFSALARKEEKLEI